MLTAKHFEEVASTIANSRLQVGAAGPALDLAEIINNFSDLFESKNPKFDRERFEQTVYKKLDLPWR